MIFTSVLNRQYRRRIAIALRLSPLFGLPCAFFKLVNGFIYWTTFKPNNGPIYSPFSTQIMDNYVDHYLYFSWTYI